MAALPVESVIVNDVTVERISVVESTPTEGRVLAVLEQTGSVDGVEQEPKPGRVEISLRKVGEDWLVDGVRTV